MHAAWDVKGFISNSYSDQLVLSNTYSIIDVSHNALIQAVEGHCDIQSTLKRAGVDPAGQGSDRACRMFSVEQIYQNWTKLYTQL